MYKVAIESTVPKYPKDIYRDTRIRKTIESTLSDLGMEKPFFKNLLFDDANVVLKPNFVFHKNYNGFSYESLVTNTSIIKVIIDLLLETGYKLNITIIDVPLQSAKWDEIVKKSRLERLINYYKKKGYNINLIDGRQEIAIADEYGTVQKRIKNKGDPLGYCVVQLGRDSELHPISSDYKKFAVTDYNLNEMRKHHNKKNHEYLICKTILNSDLFINIPKLKCHKKGGITVSLKNLIGTNASKDWLPHHRVGSKEEGGDEYPKNLIRAKLFSKAISFIRLKIPYIYKYLANTYYFVRGKNDIKKLKFDEKVIVEGSWYGNDTLWRTIFDINKIIMYATKDGILQDTKQRKYISIVDGIIGMEGEGPLGGKPKKVGVIIAGYDPASVDIISARIMGFDENRIPQLKNLKKLKKPIGATSISEIEIKSSDKKWLKLVNNPEEVSFGFIPPRGWQGHIELKGKLGNY